MPRLFGFRGYSAPDPLDRANGFRKYLILILVNLALTAVLLWLISDKIVHFNGFTIHNRHFPATATVVLEFIANGIIFSSLIIFLRKCSSLVHYAIVLIPYFLMDLYIEAHYRVAGDMTRGLWTYYDVPPLSSVSVPALKFLMTLSVDAIVFGILGIFLARCLAALFFSRERQPVEPTPQEYDALFRAAWTAEPVGKPKRDLAFYLLRLLGLGYLIYLAFLVLGLTGSSPWGNSPNGPNHLIEMTYWNPALAINTYFKISLMIMLAFTGAFNKSLRYYCCLGLFTGHLVSTIYSLVFHFYAPLQATESAFLLLSGELDGAMVLIFLWILIRYKKDGQVFAPERDNPIDYSLPMTLLRYLYRGMGLAFTLIGIGIVYIRIHCKGDHGIGAVFGYPDPMIGNTVTLYSTLAIICFLQVKREQLRAYLFNPILLPIFAGSLLALVWIIAGDLHGGVWLHTRVAGVKAQADWYFVLHGTAGIGLCLLLISLRKMFYRVDYSINTISPSAAIDCMALHGAFYGGDEQQHSSVLQSVDEFVAGITGRKRGLLNLPFGIFENVLNFIYGMRPAFSAMSREEQRFYIQKYFLRNEAERKRAFIPPLAELAYQVGISLNTIITFAQFNSINARADIGYVPVDARDRTQGDCAAYPPPHRKIADLPTGPSDPNNFKPESECADGRMLAPRLTTPVREATVPEEADYIIIGSGAGGATAAYRLACAVKDPSRILIVERGNRYQPLQDFQDDEMGMMKKVYKEGGLQQTKAFTMTMAQGQCVGGTTVINNAVCFRMPDPVREIWENDYGIDLSALDKKYDQLAAELHIAPLGKAGVNTVVRDIFLRAVGDYDSHQPGDSRFKVENPVSVNHWNNTGDGNWNLGNKRMQKRSMLETFIPWSESRGVQVVSNMMAVGFTSGPDGKADTVVLRAENGKMTSVKVKKAVIVAGGCVASSHFLMRSDVMGNTGKRLSCNFAFPITLDFDQEIKAYDGDQITLAALDPKLRGAFETYFNPPATLALTGIPFFFEKRDTWMSRYKNLLNLGSLVGSEQGGEIQQKADLINGQAFNWTLGPTDVKNIKFALSTLVQLGAMAGAKRAAIPTRPGIELDLTDPSEIRAFQKALSAYPLRITDLYIGTAHPQGGNLMAGSNGRHKGWRVINEHFQVEGHPNVFVADASLFPTSITVNPQWTIMAMSSLAVENILRLCP
jgi:hypothetical protein